jgi:DNA invertase Pin-like site-specific DNA recombinase
MRVACYARYSSDLQRATSLEDQLRVARRHAEAQGWTIDESQMYTDAGISGSSTEGRPGLQALLAAAARRPLPFDVLLVDDSSRIARDISDAIRVMQTLKFYGVRVIYISQHIDSANEQAETLVAVHGMVDSLFLLEMAKKIKRGLEGQQARGFATGGRTFGYRTVPMADPSGRKESGGAPATLGYRIDVDPAEAAVVRQIYEWYAAGDGYAPIVARLNREGCRGPRGARWRFGAVRHVLNNERYLGRQIWGQRVFDRRPGTRQKVSRAVPREEWRVQDRPELRIVSDALWHRVRVRQAEVRAAFGLKAGTTLVRGKNAAVYSRYLFSGLLRCGICGRTMTVVSNGTGGSRYGCPISWKQGTDVCTNRVMVRTAVADGALVAGLRAELLRPEVLEGIVTALSQALNALIDRRPQQRREVGDALSATRRRLEHLVQAIETGASAPTLLQAISTREAEMARLEAHLRALDEPLENKLAVIPSWVRQQLEDTAGLLADTPERTKAVFKRMGVQFTLHPMGTLGERPYFRAVGETDVAEFMAGELSMPTSGRSGARAEAVKSSSPAPSTHAAPGGRDGSVR